MNHSSNIKCSKFLSLTYIVSPTGKINTGAGALIHRPSDIPWQWGPLSASDRAALQRLITNIVIVYSFISLRFSWRKGNTSAHPCSRDREKKDNTAFMRWGERGGRHWASLFLWTKGRCITARLNDDQGGRLSETSTEKKTLHVRPS